MIAAHGESTALLESLDSVFSQRRRDFECILVVDGGLDEGTEVNLSALVACDHRLRVLRQPASGLTKALIRGCAAARGEWIARLDVGDVMAAQRLDRQAEALASSPGCVLATSDVEVCGPVWEHLRFDSQPQATGQPIRADSIPAQQGLSMDIPHHASVMFRRSAYEAVGGYRPEFYFGQDWDLWYRLAGQGTFVHIPEVLTRVRLFPGGLSSRHWREQRTIAQLSITCHVARSRGESEDLPLRLAAAIRPRPKISRRPVADGARAEGAYFIAEALRRNRDRRCWPYFLEALRHGFWKPRIWVRALQALTMATF